MAKGREVEKITVFDAVLSAPADRTDGNESVAARCHQPVGFPRPLTPAMRINRKRLEGDGPNAPLAQEVLRPLEDCAREGTSFHLEKSYLAEPALLAVPVQGDEASDCNGEYPGAAGEPEELQRAGPFRERDVLDFYGRSMAKLPPQTLALRRVQLEGEEAEPAPEGGQTLDRSAVLGSGADEDRALRKSPDVTIERSLTHRPAA